MTYKSPLTCPTEYCHEELETTFNTYLHRYERADKRTKAGKAEAADCERIVNFLRPHVNASITDKTYPTGRRS